MRILIKIIRTAKEPGKSVLGAPMVSVPDTYNFPDLDPDPGIDRIRGVLSEPYSKLLFEAVYSINLLPVDFFGLVQKYLLYIY